MINILEQQLREAAGRAYPLHMPGHKRRPGPAELPWGIDFTEVEGVDNLHEAEGVLWQAQERTARLNGAERTWYLVGGSTCGILAMIGAAAEPGSTIVAARNAHRSVFHAIALGNLSVHWITPAAVPEYALCGSITPQQVLQALTDCPQARAVVLTSPTYEGVVSDIAAIARICHAHGVPLLVDGAHGAHLGLPGSRGFPRGAVQEGADLVVESAHKTLPALTQTAWLHLCRGSLVDPELVDEQLDIYETSSPSYPLMVSLDACTGLIREQGEALYARWREGLAAMDEAAGQWEKLRLFGYGRERGRRPVQVYDRDPGKLLIRAAGAGMSGAQLAGVLRRDYGFETEMSQGGNLLAMTGMGDDPAQLRRLGRVLTEIDRRSEGSPDLPSALVLPRPQSLCTIAGASLQRRRGQTEEIALSDAVGRGCAEYVYCYPPGIPILAPGEEIREEHLDLLTSLAASGTAIHQSVTREEERERRICVLC